MSLSVNNYQNSILKLIRGDSNASRIKIAEVMGLNPTTVGRLIEGLIKQGVIEEGGLDVSSGGRRARLLKINPDYRYAIGCDLGASKLRIAITDSAGVIRAKFEKESEVTQRKSEAVITEIIELVQKLIHQSKIPFAKIIGIGFGISAVTDKNGNCLFWPSVRGWEGIPLKTVIEDKINLGTFIDDSSRTSAIAIERYELGHQRIKNLIYLGIGIGVGTGVFINGHIYRGSKNIAGELGHTTVDEHGPRCGCGNYGCLENLVSGPAIIKTFKNALEEGVNSSLMKEGEITLQSIAEAMKKGDKLAFSILSKISEYIGIGIANAINLFDPELVILGGGVIKALGDFLIDGIRNTVRIRALEEAYRGVRIELSHLGEEVGAQGAATIVLDDFFDKYGGKDG